VASTDGPTLAAPVTKIIPIPQPFSITLRHPRQVQSSAEPTTQTGADDTASGPAQAVATKGKQAVTKIPVKVATKYRENVLSEQNIFMKRLMDENPDVLYTDYQSAFQALSAEERDLLKAEVAMERKRRKAQKA